MQVENSNLSKLCYRRLTDRRGLETLSGKYIGSLKSNMSGNTEIIFNFQSIDAA